MPLYPKDIPVVIVGAGPTGLTAANLLAVYGIDCVILEKNEGPMDLPRALVIDDEGARTMQVFGLDKTYLKDTLEGVGSRYYDDEGNCFAETGRGSRNFGFAKRIFFFQPELEAALRDVSAETSPGTLHFGAQVTDVRNGPDHALVTVQDADGHSHQIRTHWVLACDGGRSPTRERLGIPMSGNTYAEDWIVVDTVNDPDRTLYSKFFCSGSRPTVSVPAPFGGRRYEFMLQPGETREQVLEDGFLEALMAPYRPYRTKDIIRKTVYRFHARMAEQFQSGRILLMGDAAHLTPPFAGQGMNAGLRDALNVAWKLAAILRGGADAHIMQSYEAERRKPAWDMIQLAVAMGSIVMPAGRDQIICIGLNYMTHITETGRDKPAKPSIFTRYPSSVVGHDVPMIRPQASDWFDFEGELAVIIGKAGRNISEADAMAYVGGYSCFNDGSIRDYQRHTSQFWAGKNFIDSGSMGPWLVTADEMTDPAAQTMETRLNGEVVQSTPISDLAFNIPELIAYLSIVTELLPGDVIATGTPSGVGLFREPKLFMKDGDRVEVEISGIGTLSNPIRDEGQ